MDRRGFLAIVGAGAAAGLPSLTARRALAAAPPTPASFDANDWEAVRKQFEFDRAKIHMAGFFLASHPRPVRDAIEAHRRGLDGNPLGYLEENGARLETDVRAAASEYLGGTIDDLAMTDSTTMGLGLIYHGIKMRPEQEILTTEHDHMATTFSLQNRALATGAKIRTIPLFQRIEAASQDEIVAAIAKSIRPETRVIAVTWVHSSTGLKIPVAAIGRAVEAANKGRSDADRVIYCVDGVHGFGVEDVAIPDLRCDFFMAGCHKWIFGPRGTGLIWGSKLGWTQAVPSIPSFDMMWRHQSPSEMPIASRFTPGGFHSFEHRWALPEAFRFHKKIGKTRVAQRIHALNRQLKEGLQKMPKVKLYTPVADELSAGIVCFDVKGLTPRQVVERLGIKGIIASTTPYKVSYARLSAGLLNSPAEVDTALREIRALA